MNDCEYCHGAQYTDTPFTVTTQRGYEQHCLFNFCPYCGRDLRGSAMANLEFKLVDKIGRAALLEQTAEECSELAQACLKLARLFRKENPIFKSEADLHENLAEEIADVLVCSEEIIKTDLISCEEVMKMSEFKIKRMNERLKNKEEVR